MDPELTPNWIHENQNILAVSGARHKRGVYYLPTRRTWIDNMLLPIVTYLNLLGEQIQTIECVENIPLILAQNIHPYINDLCSHKLSSL